MIEQVDHFYKAALHEREQFARRGDHAAPQ
jgi:hypothetical protein